MTIGLILLAIIGVLIFFGLLQSFLFRCGLTDYIAFIFIFMLAVGVLIPDVRVFNVTFNIGGFVVPLIISGILFVVLCKRKEILRPILTSIATLNCVVIVKMLMIGKSNFILSSLLIGFLAGAVAYLMGGSLMCIIFGCISGVALGDSVSSIISYFIIGSPISFGTNGIFNAIIISFVFGVAIFESVRAIEHVIHYKKHSPAHNFEASDQFDIPAPPSKDDYDDYFDDDMF